MKITHEFVDAIPHDLEEHRLYISLKFRLTAHLCFCGCARKVTASINPARWNITYNGDVISMLPSFGNWNFPCQSHYYITKSEVRWAKKYSSEEIQATQAVDQQDLEQLYEVESEINPTKPNDQSVPTKRRDWFRRLFRRN